MDIYGYMDIDIYIYPSPGITKGSCMDFDP